MPWQVKAMATLGVPACVAFVLMWVIVKDVRDGQTAMLAQHREIMATSAKTGDDMRDAMMNLFQLQQTQCLNDAMSEREARNCENPWSATRPEFPKPPARSRPPSPPVPGFDGINVR